MNEEYTFQEADGIAEALRQEPYSLLFNDCIIKSIRFVRACHKQGIKARMVLTLGRSKARLPMLGQCVTMLVIHSWGEVGGEEGGSLSAVGGVWYVGGSAQRYSTYSKD